METSIFTESTGKETKAGSREARSNGKSSKRSTRKESQPIDLSTRLRIVQQSLFDYQQAGGKIVPGDVGTIGTAFVLLGVEMDGVGNLRLIEDSSVGNVGTTEEKLPTPKDDVGNQPTESANTEN